MAQLDTYTVLMNFANGKDAEGRPFSLFSTELQAVFAEAAAAVRFRRAVENFVDNHRNRSAQPRQAPARKPSASAPRKAGFAQGARWTPEEDAKLLEAWNGSLNSLEDIAKEHNRTVMAIAIRLCKTHSRLSVAQKLAGIPSEDHPLVRELMQKLRCGVPPKFLLDYLATEGAKAKLSQAAREFLQELAKAIEHPVV